MKKIIRLTEEDLHRIIENSVRRVLKEGRGRLGYSKSRKIQRLAAKG